MKKGRFLWSAHRITEKQKAGKARNIKGKRQLKNFNTVSKPQDARRSSPRDNFLEFSFEKGKRNIDYGFQSPEHMRFGDFVWFLYKMPVDIYQKMSII